MVRRSDFRGKRLDVGVSELVMDNSFGVLG